MLNIVASNHFKRDLKLAMKRGYDIRLLAEVVDCLTSERLLDVKYHDHPLSGIYDGFRECHVTPDWLLIYQKREHELILFLSRTGTHSDLF